MRRFVRTRPADLSDSRGADAGGYRDRPAHHQRSSAASWACSGWTTRRAAWKASADENLLNQHREVLKDDELVILQASCRTTASRVVCASKVQQVWRPGRCRPLPLC